MQQAMSDELFGRDEEEEEKSIPPPPPVVRQKSTVDVGLLKTQGTAPLRWTTFHGHTLQQLAEALVHDEGQYCLLEWLVLLHDARAHDNIEGAEKHLLASLQARLLQHTLAFMQPGRASAAIGFMRRWTHGASQKSEDLLSLFDSHETIVSLPVSRIALDASVYFAERAMSAVRPPLTVPAALAKLFLAKDDKSVLSRVHTWYAFMLDSQGDEGLAGLFEILRMSAARGERSEFTSAAAANKKNPVKGDITRRASLKLRPQKLPPLYKCGTRHKHHTFDYLLLDVLELVARTHAGTSACMRAFVHDMCVLYDSSSGSTKNPLALVQAVLCITHRGSGMQSETRAEVTDLVCAPSRGEWRDLTATHRMRGTRPDIVTAFVPRLVSTDFIRPEWTAAVVVVAKPSRKRAAEATDGPTTEAKRARVEVTAERGASETKPPEKLDSNVVVRQATLIKMHGQPVYMASLLVDGTTLCGRVIRPHNIDYVRGTTNVVAADEIKHRLGLPSGRAMICRDEAQQDWLLSLDLGEGGPNAATAHTAQKPGRVRTLRAFESGAPCIDLVHEQERDNPVFWLELTLALLWRRVLGCGHTTSSNLLFLPKQQRMASVGETGKEDEKTAETAGDPRLALWTTRPCEAILAGIRTHWSTSALSRAMSAWCKELKRGTTDMDRKLARRCKDAKRSFGL